MLIQASLSDELDCTQAVNVGMSAASQIAEIAIQARVRKRTRNKSITPTLRILLSGGKALNKGGNLNFINICLVRRFGLPRLTLDIRVARICCSL